MEKEKRIELVVFGKVLKNIRKNRGFTQEQLSIYSRVDRSYISELENGEKVASFLTMVSLTRALGISMSDLMIEYEKLITSDNY